MNVPLPAGTVDATTSRDTLSVTVILQLLAADGPPGMLTTPESVPDMSIANMAAFVSLYHAGYGLLVDPFKPFLHGLKSAKYPARVFRYILSNIDVAEALPATAVLLSVTLDVVVVALNVFATANHPEAAVIDML